MRKIILKNKGITLITLVITIIVLLILASVATYSGINVINSSKLTTFTTEMKIMQTQINSIYEKYKDGNGITVKNDKNYIGEEILNIGLDLTTNSEISEQANIVFSNNEQASGITDKTGYKYWSNNLIKSIGIDGIEQDFFVNVAKRSVVSYDGLNYNGQMYYTLDQLPSNLYNVEYKENTSSKPTFDVKIENVNDDKWRITVSNIQYDGYIDKWEVKYQIKGRDYWNTSEDLSFIVKEDGIYNIKIQNGNVESDQVEVDRMKLVEAPEGWVATRATDNEWYSYNDVSSGDRKVNVNSPELKGKMTPIKYVSEEQTGSKWANIRTNDGSMFVWIPRYAYKITEGYHSNIAGTIEVAFINTSNQFLNGESGEITSNPSEEGAGTTKWLVHPAFTSSAENGGGFGEIEGIWAGKFEATGTKSLLTVKPGENSLINMTINEQYKLAKSSAFGENVSLNSHMAKNSEWGAITYLAHSKYGTNKQKVEQNTNSSYYTGGTNTKEEIYKTNKKQSTTHNATGVYDMNGGTFEYIASYVNNGGSYLTKNGGIEKEDLYGADAEERGKSTAYKMVYEGTGSQSSDYEIAKRYKGDGVYETSSSSFGITDSWFNASTNFPPSSYPFFIRSGKYDDSSTSIFYFYSYNGSAHTYNSFRLVLVI